MPAAQSRKTCRKNMAKTSRAGAPRQRRVAMVRARPSSQARTPVATPMPPTSRALNPTSVRNRLVCCTACSRPLAASRASRMRQPVSGKSWRSAAMAAGGLAPGGSSTRHSWVTSEPGCTSPVARKEASSISTRGPRIAAPPAWSGSKVRIAASFSLASPSLTVSPTCRPRRCSTRGSAITAPCRATTRLFAGGSSPTLPMSG